MTIEERARQWAESNIGFVRLRLNPTDEMLNQAIELLQDAFQKVYQLGSDDMMEAAAKVCKDLQTMQERHPHDNCGAARARCYGQCAQEIGNLK